MMNNARVIPCLQISEGKLVKTIKFRKPQYIGDPINAVKIFNDKEVDELIIVDISKRSSRQEIDYQLLQKLASESFIPMCYGGGINSFEDAKKIINMGFEKVSLNNLFKVNPELVSKISEYLGAQSVVISIDVKKNIWGKYQVFDYEKMKTTGISPIDWAKKAEEYGAGEILLNFVDRDGTFSGYDISFIKTISDVVSIPIIAMGGASGIDNMKKAVVEGRASAVAAGSLFVFYGELKSVLINYPTRDEIESVFK